MKPTKYEIATHKGRQICEAREMGGGYCGSIDLEGHIAQMKDPDSWVHSSLDRWYKAGLSQTDPVGHTLQDLQKTLDKALMTIKNMK